MNSDEGGRLKTINRLLDRAPRWLVAVVGVAAVVLGLYLVVRPAASLSVLVIFVALSFIVSGIGDFLEARSSAAPRVSKGVALAWIVTGLVLLVLPGLTIRTLATIVAIALVVSGVSKLNDARAGSLDARAAAIFTALASFIFAVLAVTWPDLSTVVIAVIFGARTIWFGLTLIWGAIRSGDRAEGGGQAQPGLVRRWARLIGSAIPLLLAVVLAVASSNLQAGAPVVDEFYDAPGSVPAQPGQLLKAEPFTRTIPDGAQAWRILYTTTRDEGQPALASAIVVAPTSPPVGPRPVIAWAHGTTGFDRSCAPSVLKDPFGAGAFFSLDKVLEEGWVLVATDYVGLGTAGPHPYLVGQGEGRSVLDAARAVRQLPELQLSDQTVVWGHSQGGNSALWTGALAPTYAPELDLAGVAALAPASDLQGLVQNLPSVTGGSIFTSFVVAAYTSIYPDVRFDSYIRPGASAIVRQLAERCLADPRVFASLLDVLSLSKDPDIFATDPTTGAFGQRLTENTPTGPIPAPLFIGQGEADSLVLARVQDQYVAARCAAGQALEYRTYAGRDHVPLVEPDSPLIPDLFTWTQDRLDGKPATSTC
jgi:uncharacterized membrane protein HdeD (DUF308 family)/alpha-beta hydrolase superfamily lysophospholipase